MTTRTKWIILIIFIAFFVTLGTITLNNMVKMLVIRSNEKTKEDTVKVYQNNYIDTDNKK